MGASERVRTFLDEWEKRGYDDAIYGLGGTSGIMSLKVSDIREILEALDKSDSWECTNPHCEVCA